MTGTSSAMRLFSRDLARRGVTWVRAFALGGSDRFRAQRDAVTAFSIRIASAGLLYVTQAILARWMGSFEFGIYVFVWTWVLVLGGLSHAGLGMAMIRLVPQLQTHHRLDALRGLLFGGRLSAVVLSTCVAGVAGLVLWRFQDAMTQFYLLPLFLALFCLPLFTLTEVQDGIGRGQAWMLAALLPPYILRPLLLLLGMTGALAAGWPATAVTATGAAIVATWLTAIIQLLMIQRRLRQSLPVGPRVYEPGLWARTSLPLMVMGGCEMLLQTADVLIVSRYMSPDDVGIYFAAAKTMSLIMFVHYAVGSALANQFAARHAHGDRVGLRALARDAVNWTFWPSLAAAIAILLFGRFLLSLFGPTFIDGFPVMVILALGFLFRSAMGPAEFLLNMAGEQRRCALSLLAAASMSLALNFWLVPWLGLIGAAIGTSMALATAALLNSIAARQRLGVDVAIWSNIRT